MVLSKKPKGDTMKNKLLSKLRLIMLFKSLFAWIFKKMERIFSLFSFSFFRKPFPVAETSAKVFQKTGEKPNLTKVQPKKTMSVQDMNRLFHLVPSPVSSVADKAPVPVLVPSPEKKARKKYHRLQVFKKRDNE